MSYLISTIFISFLAFSAFADTYETCEESALVIIDMQPYFANRIGYDQIPQNKAKLDELVASQLKVIEEAKKNGLRIIFVEYKNSGFTNSQLTAAVNDYDKAVLFTKNTDGVFDDENRSKSDLLKYLKNEGISNLIMMGANGGACVKWSIYGALAENSFNVYAYPQGIADFNHPKFIYPYNDRYNFQGLSDFSFVEVDSMSELSEVMEDPAHAFAINDNEYEEYVMDGNYYCDDSALISAQ